MHNVWTWLNSRSTGFKAIAGTIAAVASLVGIIATVVALSRGEGDGNLDTILALKEAVGRVQDAGSSRIEFRVRILGRATPDTTARGVFDYRRRVGRLTVSRDGAVRAGIIYDGDTTYVRSLEFARDRWLRFNKGLDFQASLSALFLAPDPSRQLYYLRGLIKPRNVGEETVFGVSTTHYVGRRTLKELPQNPSSPPNASSELQRELRRVWAGIRRNLSGASETIDAWIDAAGLVRRVQTTTSARYFTFRYVVDIHDFGVPVNVRPPRQS